MVRHKVGGGYAGVWVGVWVWPWPWVASVRPPKQPAAHMHPSSRVVLQGSCCCSRGWLPLGLLTTSAGLTHTFVTFPAPAVQGQYRASHQRWPALEEAELWEGSEEGESAEGGEGGEDLVLQVCGGGDGGQGGEGDRPSRVVRVVMIQVGPCHVEYGLRRVL